MAQRPVWISGRCCFCGTCIALSGHGGATLSDGKVLLNPEAPEAWDALMDECPTGALRMDSRWMSAEEVVAEVKKDSVFYAQGGGVTLSGGEPLAQGEFAVELLRAFKAEGLHTAIESSLSVPARTAQAAMPLVDQIYVDVKLADSKLHKAYTGAGNTTILDNLRWLLSSELRERVCVRTPLIPGKTATEENIRAIAELLADMYPEVRYELLNYNPLAEAKYHDIELTYCFDAQNNPPLYTKEQMQQFVAIAQAGGLNNAMFEA